MEKLTAEDREYGRAKMLEYGITPIHINKMKAVLKSEMGINLDKFLKYNELTMDDLAEMCLINYANLLHYLDLGYYPVIARRVDDGTNRVEVQNIKLDPRYTKRKFDPTNYPNQYKIAFKIMMEIPSSEHHFLCYTFCMVDHESKKILRVVDEGPLLGLQEEVSIIQESLQQSKKLYKNSLI